MIEPEPSLSLPRAGRRRLGPGAALAGAALIMPPLAVFAPLGLAPLLAAAAAAALATDARRCLGAARSLSPLALLLALLGLWGTLSAAWSILPLHSLLEGLRFLAVSALGIVVLAAGLALDPAERDRLGRAAIAGIVAAAALLLVERATAAGLTRLALGRGSEILVLTRFDRGVTTLVLALWPALAWLVARRRGWPAALLALAVVGTAEAMVSTTARIAVVAGLLVLPLAALAPRFVSAVLALGLVVAAVALPALAPDSRGVVALHEQFPGIKESAIHRLLIWRFAADRIAERPLAGWGMDASRELPGGHTNLADLLPEADLAFDAVALPLHPHDALLQWEVELGLPGVALGLAVLVWPLWRIGWRWPAPPGAQGAALAGATAALAVALLSFGIWQAWWLSGLWLVAAQLAAIAQGPGNSVSMRPMTR